MLARWRTLRRLIRLIHIKGTNLLTRNRILLKLLLRLEHRLEIQSEYILVIDRAHIVTIKTINVREVSLLVIVEILREDPVLLSIILLRWGSPPGQAKVSIKARVMITHC